VKRLFVRNVGVKNLPNLCPDFPLKASAQGRQVQILPAVIVLPAIIVQIAAATNRKIKSAKMKNKLLLLLLLSFIYTPLNSANKVITKQFNWQIYKTEHFDIYFYDEGKNIAPLFEDFLEKSYRSLTSEHNLQIEKEERIPVFLYIGHNDFEQTNIADIGEGTGGVTEAFKNRLVLYYNGPKSMLLYLTKHELTHAIEFNVLFGGFWKSAKLIKFVLYPNWLMEGLAEYNTKDLASAERDMYLRDAVISGNLISLQKLHSFGHVKPHQVTLAYKESNALMLFIEQEYGKDKLAELLNSYREKIDPNMILLETLGISLDDLNIKFNEYLEEKYTFESEGLQEPEKYGKRITASKIYNDFNTNPVFGTEDKKLFYITDKKGFTEIVCQNLETGIIEMLVGQKDKGELEYLNNSGRGLSVSKDNNYLVFVGEKQQKDYIYLYNYHKKDLSKIKTGFDVINSADISYDGSKILFVALGGGYTGIYTCDINGTAIKQVFKDLNDVSDARFSKDGTFMVFTKETKTSSSKKPYQKDLYKYIFDSNELIQLTDMEGDEFSPDISPDGSKIIFVSDSDGMYNLYEFDINTKQTKKLTNIVGGNFNPSFSNSGKSIAFSSYRKGSRQIYIAETALLENEIKEIVKESIEKSSVLDRRGSMLYSRYKLYPSTDLFFPLFYYSTYDGLYIAMYWQISEMLGNHTAAVSTQYSSGSEFLDYSVNYAFLKYRPQLFFNFTGEGAYLDWYGQYYRVIHSQTVGVNYPIDRVNSVIFAAENSVNTFLDKTDPVNIEKTVRNGHAFAVAYVNNTIERKFIQPTSGSRFEITQQFGIDDFGGDYVYQNTTVEYNKYFSLGKEHALGNRLMGIVSGGRDKSEYRLERFDRVRMYANNQVYGSKLLVYNLEWRFPIVYDIDYYTAFMFPDFLFRSFYGTAFIDNGFVSKDIPEEKIDYRYSYGIGIGFDTFVLQSFYMPLNFYAAYSPINDKYEYYFNFGSVF